ncbi:PTS sugar transporter subunit IIA [Bacillus sp. C1]
MDIFHEQFIYPKLSGTTFKEILEKVSTDLLIQGFVKETFSQAVLEREMHHPTGLPTGNIGVAIPHTDSSHIIQPVISVITLESSIPFTLMGNLEKETTNVQVLFLLALQDGRQHIQILKEIMKLIQHPQQLQQLTAASTKLEIINSISALTI